MDELIWQSLELQQFYFSCVCELFHFWYARAISHIHYFFFDVITAIYVYACENWVEKTVKKSLSARQLDI